MLPEGRRRPRAPPRGLSARPPGARAREGAPTGGFPPGDAAFEERRARREAQLFAAAKCPPAKVAREERGSVSYDAASRKEEAARTAPGTERAASGGASSRSGSDGQGLLSARTCLGRTSCEATRPSHSPWPKCLPAKAALRGASDIGGRGRRLRWRNRAQDGGARREGTGARSPKQGGGGSVEGSSRWTPIADSRRLRRNASRDYAAASAFVTTRDESQSPTVAEMTPRTGAPQTR